MLIKKAQTILTRAVPRGRSRRYIYTAIHVRVSAGQQCPGVAQSPTVEPARAEEGVGKAGGVESERATRLASEGRFRRVKRSQERIYPGNIYGCSDTRLSDAY